MTKRQRVISVILVVWSVVLIFATVQNQVSAPVADETVTNTPFPLTMITSTSVLNQSQIETATMLSKNRTDIAMAPWETRTARASITPTVTPTLDYTVMETAVSLTQTAMPPIYTLTAVARLSATPTPPAPTPMQTTTAPEITYTQQDWQIELERRAGFSHSLFDMYVEQVAIASMSPNEFYDHAIDIERVNFEDATYVAIIARKEMIPINPYFWIFKVIDGQAIQIPFLLKHHDEFGGLEFSDFGFKDTNGNSYPELFIFHHTYGNIDPITINIIEIRDNDQIVDLTPEQASPYAGIQDSNGDGRYEIILRSTAFPESICGSITHLGWDGEAYINITNTLDRYLTVYQPPLARCGIDVSGYSSWQGTLEAIMGFSHPALTRYAEGVGNALGDNYERYFYQLPDWLQIEKVRFHDIVYVAFIGNLDRDDFFRKVMFFKVIDGQAELLANPIERVDPIGMWTRIHEDGFKDYNGNGYPDIIIHTDTDGKYTELDYLIEISPDGTFVDLTPEGGTLGRYIYMGKDGLAEINYAQPVSIGLIGGYQSYSIIYGWNGTEFVDITSTLEEPPLYTRNIRKHLSQSSACQMLTGDIYIILEQYWAMGRLEEEWAEIEPMLDFDNCQDNLQDDIDDFLEWVEWKLANPRQVE